MNVAPTLTPAVFPVVTFLNLSQYFPVPDPGAPDLKMSVAEFPDDDIIPIGSNATIVCVSHRGDVKNVDIVYLQPYLIRIYLFEAKIHQCGGRYHDVEDSKTCKYVIVNGTEMNSGNYTCQSLTRTWPCTEETITLTFKGKQLRAFSIYQEIPEIPVEM